jgi:1,2-diacylglycerol 3-alpha-glucosyltransferase
MKILHLCLASFYIDNFSYQENILPKYHKKISKEVVIITSLQSFDSNGRVCYLAKGCLYKNEHDITVKRLEYKNSLASRKLRKYKGTYEAILKTKPDIIFVHGCQFMDIRHVVKYVQQNPNVKVFVDNHADFSNSATNWLSKNILHKIIWRYCAQLIEPYTIKFFGVLPARVDFLRDVYKIPKSKISLLPLGAEDDKIAIARDLDTRKKFRDKLSVSGNDLVIMTAGKLDHNKPEILNLMKAVSEINNPNVKLVVWGTVSDEYKSKFISLLNNDKILYKGWLEPKDTYNYFYAADLLVFPGKHSVYWEQAVGLGMPCIFRYIEGFTHIDIGGNCRFLNEGSTEEIKEKILYILQNPDELNQMRSIAQSKGMVCFSYKKIAEESIKID